MRLIDWQFYPSFKVKFYKSVCTENVYSWHEYVICLGFLQTRWWGKPWYNILQRSPEYTEGVKRLLLEDLKKVSTMGETHVSASLSSTLRNVS